MPKRVDENVVLLLLTAGILGLVGFRAFSPGGVVSEALGEWRTERQQRSILEREWSTIARGSRVDRGTGRVAIVEFADYECSYCRQMHSAIRDLASENPEIGVVYRHLPLPNHPLARPAARAAVCAAQQGMFLDMHASLYEDSSWRVHGDLLKVASEIEGVDLGIFESCLASEHPDSVLDADMAAAALLGFRSTPSFAAPGGVRVGVQTVEELLDLADSR